MSRKWIAVSLFLIYFLTTSPAASPDRRDALLPQPQPGIEGCKELPAHAALKKALAAAQAEQNGGLGFHMSGHTLRYVREGEDVIRPLTHALDIGRPRYWEAEATQLTLRTKDDKGTVLSVSVWRKESGAPSF